MQVTSQGAGFHGYLKGALDNRGTVTIAGLLSAAAYLSAQVIAAVRMRPERARGAILPIASITLVSLPPIINS